MLSQGGLGLKCQERTEIASSDWRFDGSQDTLHRQIWSETALQIDVGAMLNSKAYRVNQRYTWSFLARP